VTNDSTTSLSSNSLRSWFLNWQVTKEAASNPQRIKTLPPIIDPGLCKCLIKAIPSDIIIAQANNEIG
jgi:hypothetical protein